MAKRRGTKDKSEWLDVYTVRKTPGATTITKAQKRRGLKVEVLGFQLEARKGARKIASVGQAWARRAGRKKKLLRP